MRPSRSAILVLYYLRGVAQIPSRRAIEDHLFCWSRHSRHSVIYHNYAFGFDWNDYADLPICAVFFDTLALNLRWDPEVFLEKIKPVQVLRHFPGPKLAMPQDEFIHSDVLCDFLASIGATHLLSTARPGVARRIYRRRLPTIRIGQKLTGYLEDATVCHIDSLSGFMPNRDIDIGYRAWRAEPWLGRHGQLKLGVAQAALDAAGDLPELRLDVSTSEDAVLLGDEWLRFLLRCRTTLGAEGGASVLDRDGTIRSRTRAYVAMHPEANFDEIREACFAEEDGGLDLRAIGPRHLEACATRTAQLLVEGQYQGILRSGIDYIPIAKDFSNIKQVMRLSKDTDLVRRTTENAYSRVVGSGQFTYRRFVESTEAKVIPLRDRWAIRPAISETVLEALAKAIARHAAIWEFAQHEATHLLPNRLAYESSSDPHWAEQRKKAVEFAARNKIELALD